MSDDSATGSTSQTLQQRMVNNLYSTSIFWRTAAMFAKGTLELVIVSAVASYAVSTLLTLPLSVEGVPVVAALPGSYSPRTVAFATLFPITSRFVWCYSTRVDPRSE